MLAALAQQVSKAPPVLAQLARREQLVQQELLEQPEQKAQRVLLALAAQLVLLVQQAWLASPVPLVLQA